MELKEQSARLERLLLTAALISGCFHILLSLLQYFFDISTLRYVDYALGGAVAVVALPYLIGNRSAIRRLSVEQALLIALLVWYAVSCVVMTMMFDGNWIAMNVEPYFDVCVSALVLFPLGRALARKGIHQSLKILLHIGLLLWTLAMVWVLAHVLNNSIIDTPSGGQIGMTSNIALSLNCHYNTTGAIESVFTLFCCCMVIWCRRPALKALYVLASLINYVVLILSNSRTAFLATAIAFAVLIGLAVYCHFRKATLRRRILLSVASAAAALLAFMALRALVFYLHESITHLRALLGQSSGETAGTSSARSLMDDNARTMNGRTRIWSLSLKAMVYDVQKFIFGVTPVSVISMLRTVSGGSIDVYTHNQFLEVGVALGFPGLCLFVAWTVFILRDAFRMLFMHREKLSSLVIIAVVAALAIGNLTEATLLFYGFITGSIFFLLCGWISVRGEKEARKLTRQERRQLERKAKK